jgi:energy-converting hydrogenase A subunit M
MNIFRRICFRIATGTSPAEHTGQIAQRISDDIYAELEEQLNHFNTKVDNTIGEVKSQLDEMHDEFEDAQRTRDREYSDCVENLEVDYEELAKWIDLSDIDLDMDEVVQSTGISKSDVEEALCDFIERRVTINVE